MRRGLCCLLILISTPVAAQDVVGRRLFSDQLVISEPFVEDELSLPSILHIRRPATDGEAGALVTQFGAELKKRLTSNLEGSVSGGLTLLNGEGESSRAGFDNLQLGLKYQFLRNPEREAAASVALGWEVGGTGRTATGAESFDTLRPVVLLGKGFGDLPDVLAEFKPFALAGLLGASIPMSAHTRTLSGNEVTIVRHPDLLNWGIVIEYSLLYLQSYVRNLGLPPPLDRMIPLAEFDFQTAVDRGATGRTTGTTNVGVVWAGTSVQMGVEAVVPVNERSGKNVSTGVHTDPGHRRSVRRTLRSSPLRRTRLKAGRGARVGILGGRPTLLSVVVMSPQLKHCFARYFAGCVPIVGGLTMRASASFSTCWKSGDSKMSFVAAARRRSTASSDRTNEVGN